MSTRPDRSGRAIPVLDAVRSAIEAVSERRMTEAIPFLDRPNEVEVIGRAIAARHRVSHQQDFDGRVKHQLSLTVERRQSASAFPDIVFCDIHMPDEDGFVYLGKSRKAPMADVAATPVVMLTSDSRENAVLTPRKA